MKKLLLIIVAVTMCLLSSGVAYADTVSITSQAAFNDPTGSISSEGSFAFKGTETITFKVAGKTCNLYGSARGSVPTGCNYALTVTPDGEITGSLTAGNEFCTQSSRVANSCQY